MARVALRSCGLFALAGVLTAALWFFAAPPAVACSCEGVSPTAIERGDAALVGLVVAITPIAPEWEGQQRFVAQTEVQTDLKDNLADVVYLTSEADDGGNCGVGWQVGTQIAAVIYEDGGVLRSDGCSQMPFEMAEAWQPATTIGGQATLLIGGSSPYRLAAYDQSGTPIAFGLDAGELQAVSVCPGEELVLELVVDYETGVSAIETRSLATFEIIESIPAVRDGSPLQLWNLRCDSADGTMATTSDYVLDRGVFSPATEPFEPEPFNQERFWPQLITETTAPIQPEFWMTVAIELDPPVTIEATGNTRAVRQLGSGFSFGSGDEVDGEQSNGEQSNGEIAQGGNEGVPLVREDPDSGGNGIATTVVWAAIAIALVGSAIVLFRSQRASS